jgi:hypothetical protein
MFFQISSEFGICSTNPIPKSRPFGKKRKKKWKRKRSNKKKNKKTNNNKIKNHVHSIVAGEMRLFETRQSKKKIN